MLLLFLYDFFLLSNPNFEQRKIEGDFVGEYSTIASMFIICINEYLVSQNQGGATVL